MTEKGFEQHAPQKHEKRYTRNGTTVTPEEMRTLRESSVCVLGCGGLGGGVIEGLARIGVGRITAVDGDVFDESNLNRQVLSNENNIGKSKAREAAAQMKLINSEVEIIPVTEFLDEENAAGIIKGHDIAVDALDSATARKLLERACEEEDIPLVHGAIAGWNGQVAVIMPGDRILETIYEGSEDRGEETVTGNPSFTPAVVSAMEVAETIKVLLGKDGVLRNRLLMMDLLNHQYETIDF